MVQVFQSRMVFTPLHRKSLFNFVFFFSSSKCAYCTLILGYA
uniref:Uncharacterized protein n=1 Tax=Anguilla anguilla TaxID=7936 RepID=A0A0E9WMW5_ANGAN